MKKQTQKNLLILKVEINKNIRIAYSNFPNILKIDTFHQAFVRFLINQTLRTRKKSLVNG